MTLRHRGKRTGDDEFFSKEAVELIRQALVDLNYLKTKGYALPSSLKLVGDRYRLRERQRKALERISCSNQDKKLRREKCLKSHELEERILLIDGFNLLITLESALSGGFVFLCSDGSYRDMASVHGTYKRVFETQKAIQLVGKATELLKVKKLFWYLDKPVSNSGKLALMLRNIAKENNWSWEVELVQDPDQMIVEKKGVVISSDSNVLDHAQVWFNLTSEIVKHEIPECNLIDFTKAP